MLITLYTCIILCFSISNDFYYKCSKHLWARQKTIFSGCVCACMCFLGCPISVNIKDRASPSRADVSPQLCRNSGSGMGLKQRHKDGDYSYWCGWSENPATSASVCPGAAESRPRLQVSCGDGVRVSIQSRLVLLGGLDHDSVLLVPTGFPGLFTSFHWLYELPNILKHTLFPLSWPQLVSIFWQPELSNHKVFEIIIFGLKVLLKGNL